MPFSSQPRKKGASNPQGAPQGSPCGHTPARQGCPACEAQAKAKTAPADSKAPAKVLDLPTEKVEVNRLREKIADKVSKDRRFFEKTAVILSGWINKKK